MKNIAAVIRRPLDAARDRREAEEDERERDELPVHGRSFAEARRPIAATVERCRRAEAIECAVERVVERRRARTPRLEVERLDDERADASARTSGRPPDDPVAPEERST